MKSFIVPFLTFLPFILIGQSNADFNFNKKYHPDSIKLWTKRVMNGISEKHPGFYRYPSRQRFDFLIDSTTHTVIDSLTELEFYRKLKPLFAQIGCLHTGLSLSPSYNNYLDTTATLIPLEIFISSERKVYIAKDYSAYQTLSLKSEIVTINDKPIQEILTTLLKAIPADGYNETVKILLLNHRFAFWYQTIIEVRTNFKIEITTDNGHEVLLVNGVLEEVFPSMESQEVNYTKPLEFEIQNDIGILKIHTFAKSTIKRNDQHFKKYTRDVFKKIKEEQIEKLILDVRYNSGGTDGNAALLASYFFTQSFMYWDKIEVTETIANEIKGIYKLFYRKPVKIDTSYHWRKGRFTYEFDYYQVQAPSKYNFTGQVILISNGLSMSSCSDFIAILSSNNKAIVIGQESGGGYQGNTSGMIPSAVIPAGLVVTIPLIKYTTAVDPTKYFGRGTIPDYSITTTLDDLINKKDIEIEYALKFFEKK